MGKPDAIDWVGVEVAVVGVPLMREDLLPVDTTLLLELKHLTSLVVPPLIAD